MSGIKVISKQTHDTVASAEQNNASIKMSTPSVVVIQEKLENVAEIKKDGNDLIVIMKDGQTIVLEAYFAQGLTQHALVFNEGTTQLIWTQFTDPQNFVDGVVYQDIDSLNSLLDFHISTPEATPYLYGLGVAGLVAGGITLLSDGDHTTLVPQNTTPVAVASRAATLQDVVLLNNEQVLENVTKTEEVETTQLTGIDSTNSDHNILDQTALDQTSLDQNMPDNAVSEGAASPARLSNTEPDSGSVIQTSDASNDTAATIYNVLLASPATKNSMDTSSTNHVATSPAFDLSELLSFTSSSANAGEIHLPTELNTTAANSVEFSSTDSSIIDSATSSTTADSQNFDHFSEPNFNLFDLLSSASSNNVWAA